MTGDDKQGDDKQGDDRTGDANLVSTQVPFNENDRIVMARTLWGEIRGYRPIDMLAVGWVIRNRAERHHMPFMAGSRAGHEGAVAFVCKFPWQFSCWNHDDPNYARLASLPAEDLVDELCVADDVLYGTSADPTGGADHYHTIAQPAWATESEWPPAWAHQYRHTVDVGPHRFYDSRPFTPAKPTLATSPQDEAKKAAA